MLLIWKWLFWSSAGWIRHDCWRCMRNDVMPSSIEPDDRKWRNAFPLPWPWLMIWNDLEWYPQQKIENGVCSSRKQYYETTHVSWNMLKSGSAWHRPLRAAPLQWGAHNNATSFVGGKRCALRGSLAQIGAVIYIYIYVYDYILLVLLVIEQRLGLWHWIIPTRNESKKVLDENI